MLERTKTAIKECEDYLQNCSGQGTIVESYLTQHILVLLTADMEQGIYECLDKKSEQAGEKSIQEYVSSTRKNIVREVSKKGIANFVKHFGTEAKQRFDNCLKDKEQEITRYGNAIANRHSVAHRQGVQVTFLEIKQAVEAAATILAAVKRALDIEDSVIE